GGGGVGLGREADRGDEREALDPERNEERDVENQALEIEDVHVASVGDAAQEPGDREVTGLLSLLRSAYERRVRPSSSWWSSPWPRRPGRAPWPRPWEPDRPRPGRWWRPWPTA